MKTSYRITKMKEIQRMSFSLRRKPSQRAGKTEKTINRPKMREKMKGRTC